MYSFFLDSEFSDWDQKRAPRLSERAVKIHTSGGFSKQGEKEAKCLDFIKSCHNAEIEITTAMRLALATIERALDDVGGDFEGGPLITDAEKLSSQLDALDWFRSPNKGDWSFATCVELLGPQALCFRDEAVTRYRDAEDRWRRAA